MAPRKKKITTSLVPPEPVKQDKLAAYRVTTETPHVKYAGQTWRVVTVHEGRTGRRWVLIGRGHGDREEAFWVAEEVTTPVAPKKKRDPKVKTKPVKKKANRAKPVAKKETPTKGPRKAPAVKKAASKKAPAKKPSVEERLVKSMKQAVEIAQGKRKPARVTTVVRKSEKSPKTPPKRGKTKKKA